MTELITQLQRYLELDLSALQSHAPSRRRALMLARALIVKLESPMDTILRMSWQEPQFVAALKVCHDLKVFDVLAKANKFMSVEDICKCLTTNVEPNLLLRLIRHLAAMGALREQVPNKYASTALTNAMTKKEVNSGLEYWYDIAAPICLTLPTFLKSTGYKEPLNIDEGNWQAARNTELPFFNWMNEHPRELASFADHMSGYTSDRGTWLDVYPIERLLHDAAPDGPLLVDVGGSIGHDIEKFQNRYPQESGRLIVQDLPDVIAHGKGKVDHAITMMEHDFFTPQPVKNSRAYFMHSILHDWPDDKAAEILRNLKPAFKQGYSKLLINECVLPVIGASSVVTGLDLILMASLSAKERSKADWEKLFSETGFRIVGIWTDPAAAYESVIELESIQC